MDRARRLRYLDAMGITVWQSNQTVIEPESGNEVVAADVEPKPDPLDAALERAIKTPLPTLPEVPAGVMEQHPEPESPPEPSSSQTVSEFGWSELEASVKACQQCALCEDRQQAVFGAGVHNAELMVIGEGPGAEEDKQGLPFVGPAGQLLDAMLAAIQRSRTPQQGQKAVYIANMVKCRPPQNREPKPEETDACRAYLDRQIALVNPRLIMAVGRVAAQNLLGSEDKLGQMREGLHEYRLPASTAVIPVLVTYHPAYLLRRPQDKRKAWEDLKRVRSLLTDIEQAHERTTTES